jgi:hypothetical protein
LYNYFPVSGTKKDASANEETYLTSFNARQLVLHRLSYSMYQKQKLVKKTLKQNKQELFKEYCSQKPIFSIESDIMEEEVDSPLSTINSTVTNMSQSSVSSNSVDLSSEIAIDSCDSVMQFPNDVTDNSVHADPTLNNDLHQLEDAIALSELILKEVGDVISTFKSKFIDVNIETKLKAIQDTCNSLSCDLKQYLHKSLPSDIGNMIPKILLSCDISGYTLCYTVWTRV